jgi:hypothetical protein
MKKLMNRDDESNLLEGKSIRVANVPHCFVMHYKIIRNTAYFGNSTNFKVVGSRRYSTVALQRRDSAKKQMCPYHMPDSPLYVSISVLNFSSVVAFCLYSTTG